MSETPEMVEVVARAMAEAEGPDDGLRFERMARAAIEAMRNPTHGMRGAFWDAEDPTDSGFCKAWNSAIDAALTAQPTSSTA